MKKDKVVRTVLAVIAVVLAAAAAFTVYQIIGMFQLSQAYLARDQAGQTDAGMGAILLMPFIAGASLAAAASLAGSLVTGTIALLGFRPANPLLWDSYQKKLTGSALVPLLVFGDVVLAYFGFLNLDNSLILVIPGVLLLGVLNVVWLIILLVRIASGKKALRNLPPSL